MKLINPSFEIITPSNYTLEGVMKHIEICGRTCYKSEDKIGPGTDKRFVDMLIKKGHTAMLEHGTIYLMIPHKYDTSLLHSIATLEDNNYRITCFNCNTEYLYITTNYRVIIENKLEDLLQYICEPTEFHEKRVTVKFICNRQVSHEFVRHRVFSFAQESTRYCNYTKGKFGGELTFIKPCWEHEDSVVLENILQNIENTYFYFIKEGWKPQQAATVLPNALKTELVMTGFVKDWKHFFDLRASEYAHPQAQQLAYPLKDLFITNNLI